MICLLLHNLAPIMSNFRIRGIRFVLHLGSGVGYCPYGAVGEIVRKVKHSSVRIENLLSALYMGTEYFSLARTFRTVWGGMKGSSLLTLGEKRRKTEVSTPLLYYRAKRV